MMRFEQLEAARLKLVDVYDRYEKHSHTWWKVFELRGIPARTSFLDEHEAKRRALDDEIEEARDEYLGTDRLV